LIAKHGGRKLGTVGEEMVKRQFVMRIAFSVGGTYTGRSKYSFLGRGVTVVGTDSTPIPDRLFAPQDTKCRTADADSFEASD
jgi:hypothetical protein